MSMKEKDRDLGMVVSLFESKGRGIRNWNCSIERVGFPFRC